MALAWSFKKGYNNLRKCDQEVVKNEIMQFLGITTRMSFNRRLRGIVDPKISEYNFITTAIHQRGVAKKDIWEQVEIKEA